MFDYTFKPKITKDYILSILSEETIFSYYIGTQIKPGKLYCSRLRMDKKPTCGFYRNKSGTLQYHDFATGDFFNCFSYVMKLYSCNYHKALEIIARDFGLSSSSVNLPSKYYNSEKIEVKKQVSIQVEIKDFTESELKWWESFGVTKNILGKFKIFSCKTVFLNGRVFAQSTQHSPIYGYYFGKKENIEQWRIYMPKDKNCKFIGNVPTKTIQGYKQLAKSGKLLVITKSMKDTMCLYSLGISSISPNSETQFISDKMLKEIKQRFKYIVIFYDNDLPGIQNMRKLKKLYPELIYFWIPRKYEAKDISDFYHKYGRKKTVEFIKSNLIRFKNNKNITIE